MASHNGGNKTPEQLAKIAEREDWFKLVVKILTGKMATRKKGLLSWEPKLLLKNGMPIPKDL